MSITGTFPQGTPQMIHAVTRDVDLYITPVGAGGWIRTLENKNPTVSVTDEKEVSQMESWFHVSSSSFNLVALKNTTPINIGTLIIANKVATFTFTRDWWGSILMSANID